MSRSPRARARCRWGLAVLVLIVAATWVTTARVLFRWAGPGFSVILANGTLQVYGEGFYHTWDRQWPAVQVGSGFNWGIAWPQVRGPGYINYGPDTALAWPWYVALPLWLPTAVLVIAAALAWLWPQRRKPGTCATCGYNLTGNITGRCPECGTATHAPPG